MPNVELTTMCMIKDCMRYQKLRSMGMLHISGMATEVKKRVNRVLEQYVDGYLKVIMVSHGMVMRTVYDCGDVGYAGIIECVI